MDLKIYHTALLGSEPSPTQIALYDTFGNGYRGYLASEYSEEMVVASLIIALAQTSPDDGTVRGMKRVAILTPEGMKEEMLAAIKKLAWRILVRCKNDDFAREVFKQAFKNLLLGHDIMATSPRRFVAIGYKPGDDLPEWLRTCLWEMGEDPKPLYMLLDDDTPTT